MTKSETARIAAGRELLDRAYGRSRQSMEIIDSPTDPIALLLEDIEALNRERGPQYGEQDAPGRSLQE